MKYLKKFEALEGEKFIISDLMREDIMDILSELVDDGYTINYSWESKVRYLSPVTERYTLIYVSKYLDSKRVWIKYSQISEYFKRISIYLNGEGLNTLVVNGIKSGAQISNLIPVSDENEESVCFSIRIYKI